MLAAYSSIPHSIKSSNSVLLIIQMPYLLSRVYELLKNYQYHIPLIH